MAENERLRGLPPKLESCAHCFGTWCDVCVGGLVEQHNADRGRISRARETLNEAIAELKESHIGAGIATVEQARSELG